MPNIKNKKIISNTSLFKVSELDIEFGKDISRRYEVISGHGHGAVMIIPLKNNKIIFIKECAAGIDSYAITLPKGRIDKGEEILETANRELQEEVGYKSNKLSHVFTLNLAPGYISHKTYIVIAEELVPSKLEGDEPEELGIIECSLSDIDKIINNESNNVEARVVACIYLLQNYINNNK